MSEHQSSAPTGSPLGAGGPSPATTEPEAAAHGERTVEVVPEQQERPVGGPRGGTGGGSGKDPLRGSRTSGIWAGVVVAALLLILLIVFIVQNTQTVEVSYFGWEGTAPLSVALLVAATAGLLLAILAASLRILQLRRRVRRERR